MNERKHNYLHVRHYVRGHSPGVTMVTGRSAHRANKKPFAVSPPGRFAPLMDVSPLDVLPLGRFAPSTFRLWTFRPLTAERFAPDYVFVVF